jgi:glycosyltransferase involved in cell wall biosynthesis
MNSLSPMPRIAVIIPTRNEAGSLPRLLWGLPAWISTILVADYNSGDGTDSLALQHGASLVRVTRPGYGAACLQAIAALPAANILVFLDADGSDDPAELSRLVAPILEDKADFVLGSRTLGACEPGALTAPQHFGNWLACRLIRLFWGVRFTDLGPFRAIRADALRGLAMQDQHFGWTVEMQVRAAKAGLRCVEIPVACRRRLAGKSKVSGTVKGSVKAGAAILYVIAREALSSLPRPKGRRPGAITRP